MAGPFAFGRDRWDPSHRFETSWLLPPYLLFAIRALFSLYAFVTLVFIEVWYCTHPDTCTAAQNEFSYFTVLTYWGLAFYFLVSSVHTLTYARTGMPLLDRFPRPLQALHSLLYTTIVVFPFLVTIVYWARLYPGHWYATEFGAWSNISRHAMNSGFALFEILLTRTDTMPLIHMLWIVVILAMYLGLAYVTRATKGFYVYSFLDPATAGNGIVVAYVFGILAAALIFFGIVWGLIRLRLWITESLLHMDGKFAKRSVAWRNGTGADHDLEMSGYDHRK